MGWRCVSQLRMNNEESIGLPQEKMRRLNEATLHQYLSAASGDRGQGKDDCKAATPSKWTSPTYLLTFRTPQSAPQPFWSWPPPLL